MSKETGKSWEWLKIAVLALLAAWILSGCSPCERLARRCPPVVYERDSIVVYDTFTRETKITDTLLYVRLIPEYVYVQTVLTDTARAETSYAEASAWVEGERLRLVVVNKDSAEALTKLINTLERQLRETYQSKETGKVLTVYKTKRIVKFLAGMGIGTLIMLLIRIVVFIARRR